MALTGQAKNTTTLTKLTKNAVTLGGFKKSGNGWDYNQPDITYDMVTDAQGREVLYNSLGRATTLTALPKNPA